MIILEELEIVDTELALSTMGGYEFVYKKVIESFLDTNANLIEDIEKNLVQDLDEARRLVHSCKGISDNIGAKKLFDVSKDFEIAIINNDQGLMNQLFEDFKVVFKTVMNDLKKIQF